MTERERAEATTPPVSEWERNRDAGTGRTVTPEYAAAHPDTTVTETVDNLKARVRGIVGTWDGSARGARAAMLQLGELLREDR